MPRIPRTAVGGLCFHVINRGNARAQVFHDATDFDGFENLIAKATDRTAMRVLAHCLMPNHFHMVLWPRESGDLSRFMQWLLTSHVRRYHKKFGTSGHVWQGRFKGFPVAQDDHLVTVLRYVERNALRANLVARAEHWAWSSLRSQPFLHPLPIALPQNWLDFVNKPQTDAELALVQRSLRRGTPLGSDDWAKRTAEEIGLQHTLRPRGRPRQTSLAREKRKK